MCDENWKKLAVVCLLFEGGTFFFFFSWLSFLLDDFSSRETNINTLRGNLFLDVF